MPSHPPPELSYRERLVLRLHDQGLTAAAIARELGIHRANVARILSRAVMKANRLLASSGQ